MKTTKGNSGIRIAEVRVRNFRSLNAIDVNLDRITLLTGANNSGKSSFLEAVYAAMGSGGRSLTKDDIYLAPGERRIPENRNIVIDVLIKPIDSNAKILEAFPEGSYWTELWGNGISQDDQDNDFMAFRTKLTWDRLRKDYSVERRFLREWLEDSSKINDAKIITEAKFMSIQMVEPMALYLMDAKRDIDEDMKRQKSFWGRLTSDLGLNEEIIKKIENSLNALNEEMVDQSDILSFIKTHLTTLNSLVSNEASEIEIAPIARRIRDLTKGIDINFSTEGSQTFPLSKHGMGTRSLASLLIFRAFMSWRLERDKNDNIIHPFLALEEPEAHLHPQSQKALFGQLTKIPGQLIISTHSPYIAGQCSIGNIRHFRKSGPNTEVTQVDLSALNKEDVFKIHRHVMDSNGDLLFARGIILHEGETEEFALPVFAENYWNRNVNLVGVNFVGVGGHGNYLPFLRLANAYNIPWYILSDGEEDTQRKLQSQLRKINIKDPLKASNVFMLPNGQKWEEYIISEGYESAICKMLDKYHNMEDFLGFYINTFKNAKGPGGKKRRYEGTAGRKRALVDILSGNKVAYSQPLATAIVELKQKAKRCPKIIKNLLGRVSKDLYIDLAS